MTHPNVLYILGLQTIPSPCAIGEWGDVECKALVVRCGALVCNAGVVGGG